MTSKLRKSFSEFDHSVVKDELLIPANMGMTRGGRRQVLVPNREPYVYVKLRSNPSEAIEAFNTKVTPAYNLPVLLQREGSRYVVVKVDSQRYSDWEDENPYLPRHGDTHVFDKDGGNVGSDPVWIYPYQFMPSLVSPFGLYGAENVYIFPYIVNYNNDWKYFGSTGTASLTQYNPTSGSCVLLISLDASTGNPYLLASSGTYIPESITGTSALLPYIPDIQTSRYIPLAFARLVSGTTSVGWNNLYDVRQFITNTPTGSMGLFHNELQGLQGGATGSYYHVTQTEHDGLTLGNFTALHKHSGTFASDVVFDIDGAIAMVTGAAVPHLITRPTTIESWYLYAENKGFPTGSLIADLNLIRTGTSQTIFSNQANRPTLLYNDTDGWVVSGVPDIIQFLEGDVIVPDIDQIATGTERVTIVGKVSGGGVEGVTLQAIARGGTQIDRVTRLVLQSGTMVDNGNGEIELFPIPTVPTLYATPTGTLTTSSASYADVEGGLLEISILKKLANTNILIDLNLTFFVSNANNGVVFAVANGGTDYEVTSRFQNTASAHTDSSGKAKIPGLASGVQTFRLRWKRYSGSGAITMNTDDRIHLLAQEVF